MLACVADDVVRSLVGMQADNKAIAALSIAIVEVPVFENLARTRVAAALVVPYKIGVAAPLKRAVQLPIPRPNLDNWNVAAKPPRHEVGEQIKPARVAHGLFLHPNISRDTKPITSPAAKPKSEPKMLTRRELMPLATAAVIAATVPVKSDDGFIALTSDGEHMTNEMPCEVRHHA